MNDFIKYLGANIERINDKALEYAMLDICEEWVSSDSPEWEEHGDDILEVQDEFFDEDFNEWLQGCMKETGMSPKEVLTQLKQHHQRLSDIIGEKYIDDWYETFLFNHEEEAAE